MGHPVPRKIKNKPELLSGLEFYLRAFNELDSCRQIGMAQGLIPWSAINDYSLRYNLHNEDFDYFSLIIASVDREFLAWQSTKA